MKLTFVQSRGQARAASGCRQELVVERQARQVPDQSSSGLGTRSRGRQGSSERWGRQEGFYGFSSVVGPRWLVSRCIMKYSSRFRATVISIVTWRLYLTSFGRAVGPCACHSLSRSFELRAERDSIVVLVSLSEPVSAGFSPLARQLHVLASTQVAQTPQLDQAELQASRSSHTQ